MEFQVDLHVFGGKKYRVVEIPDEEFAFDGTPESLCTLIYLWGQNEVQRRKVPSVSPGDVINVSLNGARKRYLVMFKQDFKEVPEGYVFPGFRKFPRTCLRILDKKETKGGA